MTKRIFSPILLILAVVALAACASLNIPGLSGSTSGTTNALDPTGQQPQGFDVANMQLEDKLAIGSLKLEGTDQAITAEQAKTLLPLWKAVKSLSSSTTTTSEEMSALYKQIEESMTADQVQTIKAMTLSQTDIQDLMKKYAVAFQGQGGQDGPQAVGTPDPARIATFQASRGTGNTTGNRVVGGGNFPGGAVPGGDAGMGGGFPGMGGTTNGTMTPRGTPQPGAQPNRGFRGGMSNMFITPLIEMLQKLAGA